MTHPTDDELEACAFETGLNEALKVIASIGYGKNQDVDEGHEEAYRAVETYLKDWKANKPADLDLAPDHFDWNAAIEAASKVALDQEVACSKWFMQTGQHCNVYEQLPIVAERILALKKGTPQ